MPTKTTPKPTPCEQERVEAPKAQRETASVNIEVDKGTYASMEHAAASCGYTLNEWLREVIMDSI